MYATYPDKPLTVAERQAFLRSAIPDFEEAARLYREAGANGLAKSLDDAADAARAALAMHRMADEWDEFKVRIAQ